MNTQKPLKYEVRKVKLGYAVFGLFTGKRGVLADGYEFNFMSLVIILASTFLIYHEIKCLIKKQQ